MKVLQRYGGECECCGTKHSEFLCIDHIFGNGAAERRILKGPAIYIKLAKAGVRLPGYRLLCHNCNFSLGVHGFCPHERERPDQPGADFEMDLANLSDAISTSEESPDSEGNPVPVSGFAATAKARFAAEVIRNGKVVEDDEEVNPDPKELEK